MVIPITSAATNTIRTYQRAESVRAYLVAQGILTGSVTAKGFGKTEPAGTNDTAVGRQINRRVELVVSGAAIGAQPGGVIGGGQKEKEGEKLEKSSFLSLPLPATRSPTGGITMPANGRRMNSSWGGQRSRHGII
jgi:hypothetical protein